MLNQVVLVGRLTKDPEVVETESGNKVSSVALAVPRNFKNEDGVYESDFIEVTMWNNIASNTAEYCHKGDIVGVKGRIQVDSYEKNGEKRKEQRVLAERVTFLTSKAKNEPEPEL